MTSTEKILAGLQDKKTAQEQSEQINERYYRNIGKDSLNRYNRFSRRLYNFDAGASRLFFSVGSEILGRILFLGSILCAFVAIFILSGVVGEAFLKTTNLSPLLNIMVKPVYKFFTLLVFVFLVLILFLYMIIALLIRSNRSVFILGCAFLSFGQLLFVGITIGTFVTFNNDKSQYNQIGFVFSVASLLLYNIGNILLVTTARHVKKMNEQQLKIILKYKINQFTPSSNL